MSDPFLSQIESILGECADSLHELAHQIVIDEISRFPIVILSETQIPYGHSLAHKTGEFGNTFPYLSTTEEFIQLGIIPLEKAKVFISSYKPFATHLCVFALPTHINEARFIFYPHVLPTTY